MKKKLILVADDDPKMRELLQVVLESAGFTARAAADGETALRLAREAPPDLVIADVVLPRLDGLELVRRLRREPSLAGVPVLLISGVHRESRLGLEAAEAGVADFMAKPLDLEALVAKVSGLTGTEAEEDSMCRAARRLERLRQAYLRALPERVERLREDWFAYLEGRAANVLERLHRAVHAMAGTGGTLGLTRLGELAGEVEDILEDLLSGRRTLDPPLRRRITLFLSTVEEAFGRVPAWAGPSRSEDSGALPAEGRHGGATRILLLEDDEAEARRQTYGLETFGYHTRWARTQDEALEALDEEPFAALVVDLILGEETDGGLRFLEEVVTSDRQVGPALVLSRRDDLQARLAAVRLGAAAYLNKPVTVEEVVDALDRVLAAAEEPEPFKLLVVDQDPASARQSAEILESAEMVAVTVESGEKAVEAARSLVPDLILLDEHLSGCTGLELARVLRQEEPLVFVPIVLVALEDDARLRLEAISAGVADVLVKPVPPELLAAHCRARAERGRVLRRLGSHDGLTGLLNHGAVLSQLRTELARCEREGGGLSIAMIDLDGFKQLNDRLGHLVGDRVLKTVARLLRRRLRRTDFIGRYGGDEFLVVLPGTDAAQTASVLAEVRRDLGPLLEEYGEPSARVTLSIGVADFPSFGDVAALLDAADHALYRAKAEGKDRLAIAE